MQNTKEHWEQIYSGKSPLEVSWYQAEPLLSMSLIDHCAIDKDEALIDVGGGASLLVDRLLDKGYQQLSVLDISSAALDFAKKRLAGNADKVEWFEADITAFSPPHSFALWHDRAVFHFLTEPSDRKKYLEILTKSLKTGGHLILAAFAIGGPTKCSELDIVQYDADKLENELGDQFELVAQQDEIHMTPADKEQLFSYFCFRKTGSDHLS